MDQMHKGKAKLITMLESAQESNPDKLRKRIKLLVKALDLLGEEFHNYSKRYNNRVISSIDKAFVMKRIFAQAKVELDEPEHKNFSKLPESEYTDASDNMTHDELQASWKKMAQRCNLCSKFHKDHGCTMPEGDECWLISSGREMQELLKEWHHGLTFNVSTSDTNDLLSRIKKLVPGSHS